MDVLTEERDSTTNQNENIVHLDIDSWSSIDVWLPADLLSFPAELTSFHFSSPVLSICHIAYLTWAKEAFEASQFI